MHFLPGEIQDNLYSFNLSTRAWLQINATKSSSQKHVPSARDSLGIASFGQDLYLFGGKTNLTGPEYHAFCCVFGTDGTDGICFQRALVIFTDSIH